MRMRSRGICSEKEGQMENKYRFCPECGNRVLFGMRFCTKCRTPIPYTEEDGLEDLEKERIISVPVIVSEPEESPSVTEPVSEAFITSVMEESFETETPAQEKTAEPSFIEAETPRDQSEEPRKEELPEERPSEESEPEIAEETFALPKEAESEPDGILNEIIAEKETPVREEKTETEAGEEAHETSLPEERPSEESVSEIPEETFALPKEAEREPDGILNEIIAEKETPVREEKTETEAGEEAHETSLPEERASEETVSEIPEEKPAQAESAGIPEEILAETEAAEQADAMPEESDLCEAKVSDMITSLEREKDDMERTAKAAVEEVVTEKLAGMPENAEHIIDESLNDLSAAKNSGKKKRRRKRYDPNTGEPL